MGRLFQVLSVEIYLRVARRTNKDGSVVECLHLAHNVRREGSPHPPSSAEAWERYIRKQPSLLGFCAGGAEAVCDYSPRTEPGDAQAALGLKS